MARRSRSRTLTPTQKRKRSRIAEKVKGKPGVRNPFAVATAAALGTTKKRKKKR